MSPLDEKIILATLDEGGSTFVGNFSTIHIAERTGISEFVILDHFKTRENLLEEAERYLGEHFQAEMIQVIHETPSIDQAFSQLIDYQLAHPTWNGFALNYSYAIPQFNPDKEAAEAFNERVMDEALELTKFFPGYDALSSQSVFHLYRYFLRELAAFCQTIISGENRDSPALRSSEASFLFQGLSAFLQPDLARDNA
jgi:AcrR family transcriptional regulator